MRLPTNAELTELASYLYDTDVAASGTTTANLDTSKVPPSLAGLGSSWLYLWGTERKASKSYFRSFTAANTALPTANRSHKSNNMKVICIDD